MSRETESACALRTRTILELTTPDTPTLVISAIGVRRRGRFVRVNWDRAIPARHEPIPGIRPMSRTLWLPTRFGHIDRSR
jgi:hypothetical protein